jgi:hypothetical protein
MMFIHIGYPETATTLLQQNIFPYHPEIEYWNRHTPKYAWLNDIVTLHDFDFNADKIRLKAINVWGVETAKIKLISWERLLGHPYTGGRESRVIADRLHAIFPDAKIIICIRHQLDMIDSLYRQYVHQGGSCNFEEFLNLDHENNVWFFFDYLFYDRIVAYYQKLFGFNSVFVCLYESLKETPARFMNRLFLFLNIKRLSVGLNTKVNQGMSPVSVKIARTLNRFVHSVSFNPDPVIPSALVNSRSVRKLLQGYLDPSLFNRLSDPKSFISKKEVLNNYFRKTNRSLLKRLDLPLKKYHYPL